MPARGAGGTWGGWLLEEALQGGARHGAVRYRSKYKVQSTGARSTRYRAQYDCKSAASVPPTPWTVKPGGRHPGKMLITAGEGLEAECVRKSHGNAMPGEGRRSPVPGKLPASALQESGPDASTASLPHHPHPPATSTQPHVLAARKPTVFAQEKGTWAARAGLGLDGHMQAT